MPPPPAELHSHVFASQSGAKRGSGQRSNKNTLKNDAGDGQMAPLGSTWRPKGTPWAPKGLQNASENNKKMRSRAQVPPGGHLHHHPAPKSHQNQGKNDAKQAPALVAKFAVVAPFTKSTREMLLKGASRNCSLKQSR